VVLSCCAWFVIVTILLMKFVTAFFLTHFWGKS
jgi:hypothetical protein